MPHLKCVACRVRSRVSGPPTDWIGDHCPVCEAPLEPVERPSEVLGFRLIPLSGAEPREALRGAFRWLDDDGKFDAGSVAAALANPRPPLDPTTTRSGDAP